MTACLQCPRTSVEEFAAIVTGDLPVNTPACPMNGFHDGVPDRPGRGRALPVLLT